jgi:hypothetical protein
MKPPSTRDLVAAERDGLVAAVSRQEKEITRFMALSAGWTKVEIVRVLIGHLGTISAKEMNDFLERK